MHLNDKGIKKGLIINLSLDAILRELPFRSRQLRGGNFVIEDDAVPKLQATQVISFIVPSSPTLHLLFFSHPLSNLVDKTAHYVNNLVNNQRFHNQAAPLRLQLRELRNQSTRV